MQLQISTEQLRNKLKTNELFRDYFNKFCCLPVFGQRLAYKKDRDDFIFDPILRKSNDVSVELNNSFHVWLAKERHNLFMQSRVGMEYMLCDQLLARDFFESNQNENLKNSVGFLKNKHLSSVSKSQKFFLFLSHSKDGSTSYKFWIEVQLMKTCEEDNLRDALNRICHMYIKRNSTSCLPFSVLDAVCPVHSKSKETQSFDFAAIEKLEFIVFENLLNYWLPSFLLNVCETEKQNQTLKEVIFSSSKRNYRQELLDKIWNSRFARVLQNVRWRYDFQQRLDKTVGQGKDVFSLDVLPISSSDDSLSTDVSSLQHSAPPSNDGTVSPVKAGSNIWGAPEEDDSDDKTGSSVLAPKPALTVPNKQQLQRRRKTVRFGEVETKEVEAEEGESDSSGGNRNFPQVSTGILRRGDSFRPSLQIKECFSSPSAEQEQDSLSPLGSLTELGSLGSLSITDSFTSSTKRSSSKLNRPKSSNIFLNLRKKEVIGRKQRPASSTIIRKPLMQQVPIRKSSSMIVNRESCIEETRAIAPFPSIGTTKRFQDAPRPGPPAPVHREKVLDDLLQRKGRSKPPKLAFRDTLSCDEIAAWPFRSYLNSQTKLIRANALGESVRLSQGVSALLLFSFWLIVERLRTWTPEAQLGLRDRVDELKFMMYSIFVNEDAQQLEREFSLQSLPLPKIIFEAQQAIEKVLQVFWKRYAIADQTRLKRGALKDVPLQIEDSKFTKERKGLTELQSANAVLGKIRSETSISKESSSSTTLRSSSSQLQSVDSEIGEIKFEQQVEPVVPPKPPPAVTFPPVKYFSSKKSGVAKKTPEKIRPPPIEPESSNPFEKYINSYLTASSSSSTIDKPLSSKSSSIITESCSWLSDEPKTPTGHKLPELIEEPSTSQSEAAEEENNDSEIAPLPSLVEPVEQKSEETLISNDEDSIEPASDENSIISDCKEVMDPVRKTKYSYSWSELSKSCHGPHALDRVSAPVRTLIEEEMTPTGRRKALRKSRVALAEETRREMQYRSSRAFRLLMTSIDYRVSDDKLFDEFMGEYSSDEDGGLPRHLHQRRPVATLPKVEPDDVAKFSVREYPLENLDYKNLKPRTLDSLSTKLKLVHRLKHGAGRRMGVVYHRPIYRPVGMDSVFDDSVSLEFFQRFLATKKKSPTPVAFWTAVEFMNEIKDPNRKSQEAKEIHERFFSDGICSVDKMDCDDVIIRHLITVDVATPVQLRKAQAAVKKRLVENYGEEYIQSFGDLSVPIYTEQLDIERDISDYNHRRIRERLRRTLQNVIRRIVVFRRNMKERATYNEFREFLKDLPERQRREHHLASGDASRTGTPSSLQEYSVVVKDGKVETVIQYTMETVLGKSVVLNLLPNDLDFLHEVFSYQLLWDSLQKERRRSVSYYANRQLVQVKQMMIIDCFLRSDILPKIRVNVGMELANKVSSVARSGVVEGGNFHDAVLTVLPIMLHYWKKFCNEKDNVKYVPRKQLRADNQEKVFQKNQQILKHRKKLLQKKLQLEPSTTSLQSKQSKLSVASSLPRDVPDYRKGKPKDFEPKEVFFSDRSSDYPCILKFSLSNGVVLYNHPDRKLKSNKQQLNEFQEMALKHNWTNKKEMKQRMNMKGRHKKHSIVIDLNKVECRFKL